MIVLPMPPSGNRYWRHVGYNVVLSSEAKDYRKHVGWLLSQYDPLSGGVIVTADLYFKTRSGDLDNFGKVLLDSLQGHLFHNDSQVVELHLRRFVDKHNPRVELKVEAR